MVNDRKWNKPAKGIRPYRRRKPAQGHCVPLKYYPSIEPRLCVTYDPDDFRQIVAIASEEQRSASSVIREAVKYYLTIKLAAR